MTTGKTQRVRRLPQNQLQTIGPKECEITGVDSTPDGRTLFVGIQHPGEDGTPAAPTNNWPQSQSGTASGRPRSGVVVVTRTDGGGIWSI